MKRKLNLVEKQPKQEPADEARVLNIRTTYTFRNEVTRINRAVHANSAVLRAVDHMQLNHYGATLAEVYDLNTAELHAIIKRTMSGKIIIMYEREVKEGM